jgi:hypothetical protein
VVLDTTMTPRVRDSAGRLVEPRSADGGVWRTTERESPIHVELAGSAVDALTGVTIAVEVANPSDVAQDAAAIGSWSPSFSAPEAYRLAGAYPWRGARRGGY